MKTQPRPKGPGITRKRSKREKGSLNPHAEGGFTEAAKELYRE